MFTEMLYFLGGIFFYIEVSLSYICFYLDLKIDLTYSNKLDTLTTVTSYRAKSNICIVQKITCQIQSQSVYIKNVSSQVGQNLADQIHQDISRRNEELKKSYKPKHSKSVLMQNSVLFLHLNSLLIKQTVTMNEFLI